MSDFIANMAQMIAQSRPQFQASGGRTPVVPNYGGLGMGGSAKGSQTNLGVEIPSMNQLDALMGRLPREQRLKLADMAYETFNFLNGTMDPKEVDSIVRNPDYQAKMAKFHEDGYPAIIRSNDEAGNPTYRWIPGPMSKEGFIQKSEEAMKILNPQAYINMKGGGLTQPQIEAGMGGTDVTEKYVDTSRRIAEATYNAKARAEMENVHPSIIKEREAAAAHNIAGARNQEALARYHQAQTRVVGADLADKQAKTKAEVSRLEADTVRIEAETAKIIETMKIDPLAKEGAKEANHAYNTFYQTWLKEYAGKPDNEGTNLRKNLELGGAVLSHVQAIKQYTGSGELASHSIVRWFNSVDREFMRPTQQHSYVPFKGASKAAVELQKSIRQQYFSQALDIISTAGGMTSSMRAKVYQWGRVIGYPDSFIQQKLKEALGTQQQPQQPAAAPPSIMLPEGRADGGPVKANKPYVVGEKGKAEIFIPDQDGTIVPTTDLGGSHHSSKAYMKHEDSFTSMLTGEIDMVDQAIQYAKSQNPMHPISSELLERREALQNMLGKQQERMMRIHGKHMTTYQKDKGKEGSDAKS